MRKAVLATLLVAASTTAPLPAAAWDYPGHRIVGMIADAVLRQHDEAVYRRVHDLLDRKGSDGFPIDERRLGQVAVFPDCAKDEEEFCGRKPTAEEIAYALRNLGHPSYHYTNTPLDEPGYRRGGVGTSDTDIVQMINHAIHQLQGKPKTKYGVKLNDTEALWLLAHLVGDIHQPLHVGQIYYDRANCTKSVNPNDPAYRDALTTQGGNTIKFAPDAPAVPPAPTLHIYWDAITVARAMRAANYSGDEAGFAKMLAAAPSKNWHMTGDPDTWAEKWIAEALPLARRAYAEADIVGKLEENKCSWTVTLKDGYELDAQETARTQLAKAGFRLAALLVAIFK